MLAERLGPMVGKFMVRVAAQLRHNCGTIAAQLRQKVLAQFDGTDRVAPRAGGRFSGTSCGSCNCE